MSESCVPCRTLEIEVTVSEGDFGELRERARGGASALCGARFATCVIGRRTYWLRPEGGRLWLRSQLPLEALPGPWEEVRRVLGAGAAYYIVLGGERVHIVPRRDLDGPGEACLQGRCEPLAAVSGLSPAPAAAPSQTRSGLAAPISNLVSNLITGLCLAVTFRTWSRSPRPSPGQLVTLLLIGAAALVLPDFTLVPEPRYFWGAGLALDASRALLVGLAVYLAAGSRSGGAEAGGRSLETLYVLLASTAIVPAAVGKTYLAWQAQRGTEPDQTLYVLWVAWLALLAWRTVSVTVAVPRRARVAGALMVAGVLALAVDVLPGWPVYIHYEKSDEAAVLTGSGSAGFDLERIYHDQPRLVDAALERLSPQRPGRIDLYFVGFAPYAGQAVFMREVQHFQHFLDQHFDTSGRSLLLINNPEVSARVPLANRFNLARVLDGIGRLIDTDEDVVFLYLTSHGSKDGELEAELEGLALHNLTAHELSGIIEASGIRWRVVGISACYSGSFIPEIENPSTLLMTASRADRTSFGCSNEREFTYFGEALRTALSESPSFVDAFALAKHALRARERIEGKTPSLPQIRVGQAVRAKLRQLERELASG